VIDEADRLFDMGFIKDLRRILRRCPPPDRRHSMLFSATLSIRVMELSWEHMNDARKIEIRPEQLTADRVEQSLYHVSSREKLPLLSGLLARERDGRIMLFVNTKRFAERLVNVMERQGHRIGAITGDLPQAKRLKILSDFKSGKLPFLVATDVASRGLHIEGVTHVINVDLPQDPEDYVHRIGRTARAGKSGKAISLACEDYVFSLDAIQKLIGQKIPVAHAEDALFVPLPPRGRVAPQPVRSEPEPTPEPPPAPAPPEVPRAVAPEPPEPRRAPETLRPAVVPPPQVEVATPLPLLEVEMEAASDEVEGPSGGEPGLVEAAPGFVFWVREAFGLAPAEPRQGGVWSSADPEFPDHEKGPRRRSGRRRPPRRHV